jgi:DNA-binding XRE family transcriptional regulator
MNIDYEKLNDGRVAISSNDFEDIMDILAYDEAKAKNDELFPAEITKRLIDGESPLRVFREYRGYTQVQLAEKIGLTQTSIADLEKGKSKGSIDTWKELSSVLNVDIDDLV